MTKTFKNRQNINNFIFLNKNKIYIERLNRNKNIDIKILISVPSYSKENFQFAIKNRDLIIDKTLSFLRTSKKFQNLNISINNLNLKKMTYRRDGYIEIVFNYNKKNIDNYNKYSFY